MSKEDEEPIHFSLTLEGEEAKQFNAVQRSYGLRNKTEVIRVLISEKHKELFPTEAK